MCSNALLSHSPFPFPWEGRDLPVWMQTHGTPVPRHRHGDEADSVCTCACQGGEHGIWMRTGHEAWSEDEEWDPECRGGRTVGAWGTGSSHTPSLDFSCPGDILPLLPHRLVIPHGTMATHKGITPTLGLLVHLARVTHGKAVAPVTEISPGPTCLRCPALSWAGDPAPMDFVLPRAHSHPAPCSGGLAVPAWPQLPQAAAAPCLPPSAVQHGPHHSPPGLGLLGHSHTSASA